MSEYIQQQVALLMGADSSEVAPFFSTAGPYFEVGFDKKGTEAICDADDSDAPLLQLVLAVLAGNHGLAESLAGQFRAPLEAAATALIEKQVEKHNSEIREYQGAA